MEVRMQPRSDEGQRCLSFSLDVRPAAAVMQFRDFLGNIVHHFDIAGSHAELRLKAQALVEVLPAPNAFVAAERTWDDLDQMVATGDYWEMMLPSAFAHIMIALARKLRIPCRYVSGYLFHADPVKAAAAEGASHAWVEALLPGLGRTEFDPTNNVLGGESHIRVAVGRDYAEVPPTRG